MQVGIRQFTLLKTSDCVRFTEGAKTNPQENDKQKKNEVQITKESAPSKEWSFKPTIFTLKQDIRTWQNRF